MSDVKVVSPLAAKVWKIEVSVGARIAAYDVLVILESMKMEIPVEAPSAGRLAEILVEEGETVAEEQVLAIITREE